MPNCAYCGSAGTLTREHIFPQFLLAHQRKFSDVIGWNDNVKKMLAGDQTIRDVCANCNNIAMSRLDKYSKHFFSDNGLLVQNFKRKSIQLSYDYDQLLRFNLKVSFNSARTTGNQSHLFNPFISYIVGNGDPPKKNAIRLLVQLLKAHAFVGEHAAKLKKIGYADEAGVSLPFMVRVGWGIDPSGAFSGLNFRTNTFGALLFTVLIFDVDMPAGTCAVLCRKFIASRPGTVELNRERRIASLSQGPKTWLEEYFPQIERTHAFKRESPANASNDPSRLVK
jgi:hypothetical protein